MSSSPAVPTGARPRSGGPARWLWFGGGWVAVAFGSVGVVVPGLPTTVFFIVAASCFARSSPRFERWVLGLPRIGPMVADHRAGLGMPRRAKVAAMATIVAVSGASIVVAVEHVAVALAIGVLAVAGVVYIAWRVPTQEQVLAERASPSP